MDANSQCLKPQNMSDSQPNPQMTLWFWVFHGWLKLAWNAGCKFPLWLWQDTEKGSGWLKHQREEKTQKTSGIEVLSCQRMLDSWELSWCGPWKRVFLLFIWNLKEKQNLLPWIACLRPLCSLHSGLFFFFFSFSGEIYLPFSLPSLVVLLFLALVKMPQNTYICDLWTFIPASLKGDNLLFLGCLLTPH